MSFNKEAVLFSNRTVHVVGLTSCVLFCLQVAETQINRSRGGNTWRWRQKCLYGRGIIPFHYQHFTCTHLGLYCSLSGVQLLRIKGNIIHIWINTKCWETEAAAVEQALHHRRSQLESGESRVCLQHRGEGATKFLLQQERPLFDTTLDRSD